MVIGGGSLMVTDLAGFTARAFTPPVAVVLAGLAWAELAVMAVLAGGVASVRDGAVADADGVVLRDAADPAADGDFALDDAEPDLAGADTAGFAGVFAAACFVDTLPAAACLPTVGLFAPALPGATLFGATLFGAAFFGSAFFVTLFVVTVFFVTDLLGAALLGAALLGAALLGAAFLAAALPAPFVAARVAAALFFAGPLPADGRVVAPFAFDAFATGLPAAWLDLAAALLPDPLAFAVGLTRFTSALASFFTVLLADFDVPAAFAAGLAFDGDLAPVARPAAFLADGELVAAALRAGFAAGFFADLDFAATVVPGSLGPSGRVL